MITTKAAFMAEPEKYMRLAKVTDIFITDHNSQITWTHSSAKQENFLRKLLNISHPGKQGRPVEVPA